MTTELAFRAKDQVVLVIGAAGGVGEEVTGMFSAAGAKVAAADIVSRGIAVDDGTYRLSVDATKASAVREMMATVENRFGPIDHIISTVGRMTSTPLSGTSMDEWYKTLDHNLTSTFLILQEAPHWLRKPGGSVAVTCSVGGLTGGRDIGGPAYAAASAGVVSLVRYAASDWADLGIRVNAVACGPIDTPMLDDLTEDEHQAVTEALPLARYAAPEEVASALAFLCSDIASSMTGSVINVSSGLFMA